MPLKNPHNLSLLSRVKPFRGRLGLAEALGGLAAARNSASTGVILLKVWVAAQGLNGRWEAEGSLKLACEQALVPFT